MITLAPEGEIERIAREGYRKHFADPEPVNFANFAPVLELREDTLLVFRGRMYRAPPVSFEDGLRLIELAALQTEVAKSNEAIEIARGINQIQRAAVKAFRRLCRPIDWRRFCYPLCPNPFRKSSMREVDELLGFFYTLQTKSGVRYHGRVERIERSISSTPPTPSSSRTSESPKAGATSNTASATPPVIRHDRSSRRRTRPPSPTPQTRRS